MNLREEFSPTPPHITLLIRVGKLALVRLSAGRAWRECNGRDSLIKGGTSSTYVFKVSIAFCLCLFVVFFLFRPLSPVFSVFGSLLLSFILSYIQSIASQSASVPGIRCAITLLQRRSEVPSKLLPFSLSACHGYLCQSQHQPKI